VTGCDGRYSPLVQQFLLLERAELPADSHIMREFSWIVISMDSFYAFSSSKSISNAPKFECVLNGSLVYNFSHLKFVNLVSNK
jgi:hypothetical protein